MNTRKIPTVYGNAIYLQSADISGNIVEINTTITGFML
jgi:hypothetical protein